MLYDHALTMLLLVAFTGEYDGGRDVYLMPAVGGEPVRLTVPLIDVMTSELVCSAALAAIIARSQTGQGQRIEVSLLDGFLPSRGDRFDLITAQPLSSSWWPS